LTWVKTSWPSTMPSARTTPRFLEMGDELLKKIARELVESVRRNATIDWSEKEQVRAGMRAAIRRLLTRYGYPPDKQPAAIELVMDQAELLASTT
jgi:type I restriction enzyme, R subunit